MQKKIPIMMDFIVCDFCNRRENDDLTISKCEICGKDICDECASEECLTEDNDTLTLCKVCTTRFDLTAYRNVYIEISELKEQLNNKHIEAHNILLKYRSEI
jgi:hypothetical protein